MKIVPVHAPMAY